MLPINDMARHARQTKPEVAAAVERVLGSGWYILGAEVRAFEEEFASYCEAGHCVAVGNGTDALEIALRSVGMAPGCRVATVANAGYYTANSLAAIGAEPVFIEIDRSTRLMCAEDLRQVCRGEGVDAIVVTHLYGLCAKMGPILNVAETLGVPVVEDCAQAHGAARDGTRVGSFGRAAAFSFYPTKNLGAVGDGGAVVTNDPEVADRARCLRQYGWSEKYRVALGGGRNSRLDEIQAAVLRAKLPYLDSWNQRRAAIARLYTEGIQNPKVRVPDLSWPEFVAHLYVVEANGRDALQRHLRKAGIAAEVHYPLPDHLQPINREKATRALPHTEYLAAHVLTLPCFPEMNDDEVRSVIKAVNQW